jgi:hypothetical protein
LSFNCSFLSLNCPFLPFDCLSFPIIEAELSLRLFYKICIFLGENIFLEKFLKEFLVIGKWFHDDLFRLILDWPDDAELIHETFPPILATLNELIALSNWQSVVFRFVFHVFEFIADVHLHDLLSAGHGECGLPEAELVILGRAIVPDQLVETVAAIVD